MDGPTSLGGAQEGQIRPETRFFAPQARLVTPEGEPITISDRPIAPDIVSAKVTQTNSGVAQVEVVLNTQRHDAKDRPMAPSWRYNRLEEVSFGTRARVDFRYGDEPWTPMILARITDVVFEFPSGAGAQLTLRGEDLLSLLKTKPASDTRYADKQETAIVEQVLSDSRSGLSLAPAIRTPFQQNMTTVTHQQTQTYLQFVESLAQRMDHEVFVDFDDEVGSAVSLHFEPARSATLSGVVDLLWGRDIIDFKPTFKVWDVLTNAVACGALPRGRGRVRAEVAASDAVSDLHADPNGRGGTLLTAVEARQQKFSEENRPETNTEQISVSNLDAERARMQAISALRKSSREFLTAEINTVGFAALRPGKHVALSGFYAPFDGIYYVTSAEHTLNASGHRTKCSLLRPGMLDPADYPAE